MHYLLTVDLIHGPYLALAVSATLLGACAILRGARGSRESLLRAGLVGSLVAAVVVLVLSESQVLGGLIPGRARGVAALALGTAAFGIAAAVRLNRIARWFGAATAVLAVLAGFLGVNQVYGVTYTLAALAGMQAWERANLPALTHPRDLADWAPPADLPSHGRVGALSGDLRIPSGDFGARDAGIYLPPAALTAAPPALPLMVFMAGQPGTPDPALIAPTLDAFAASHGGLAPIVIVVDQTSSPMTDPACVDSTRYGAVEEYVNELVPRWAQEHLNVDGDRAQWTIAGYSNGGACATLYGVRHPEVWGAFGSVSGTEYPGSEHPEQILEKVYSGDAAAYAADRPRLIMGKVASGSFAGHRAVFTWGSADTEFGPGQRVLADAAKSAGFEVTTREVPHATHFGPAISEGIRAVLDATFRVAS
ncbi:MAG: hypothetical protein K0R81_1821 [Microbacterium sp.]|jgi:enterochelin esterase-like enzyme|nr:hypothetical protein [Microbacterium sp.]